MRKLSLFVMMMLMLSVIVSAERGNQPGSSSPNSEDTEDLTDPGESDDDVDLEDLSEDVLAQARNSSNSGCVQLLKERFPNAKENRLMFACQALKAKAIENKLRTGEIKLGEGFKNFSQDKKEMLEKMAGERKKFIERFKEEELGRLNRLNVTDFKKASELNREQLKNCIKGNESEVRDCVGKYNIIKFTNKADMFRQRTVENYKEMKLKFEDLKDRYEKIKQDLKEERDAWRDAVKSGDDAEILETGKAYFTASADLVITNLEKVKNKIMENDDLTEEEVEEMTEDIDARIAEIQAAKDKVNAATTKEELKAAAEDIVKKWKGMEHKIKLYAEYMGRTGVMDVLKRSEYMERRLENALSKMEEQGMDITELDGLVSEFSAKVDNAREKFRQGNQKFIDAKNAAKGNATREEVQNLTKEGTDLIKSANSDLTSAHETLKQILQKIRDLTGSTDVLTEESTDDYVSVEEDAAESDTDED